MTLEPHSNAAMTRMTIVFLVGVALGSSLVLTIKLHQYIQPIHQRKITAIQFVQDSRVPKRTHPIDVSASTFKGPARAYPVWNYDTSHFSCVPGRTSGRPEGNLFIGPPKAASSTTGGIMLRISRNLYKRAHDNQVNATACNVTQIHYPYPAWMYGYRNRDKTKSFLWSFLRDPTSRFTSEFFHFQVSRKGIQPTDANFQRYLQESNQNNLYIFSLHTHAGKHMMNITRAVEQILYEYNFIGITERMDESLVVLKLLFGLEMNDILYLKSTKQSGGFDDGIYNNSCTYIVKSFVSTGMKEFFDTNHVWKERTRGDILLYQAANKSLDMTIDSLGRRVVEKELQEFERAMKMAQETCRNVKLPCTDGGSRQQKHDCLYWDLACGYECLENLHATE